jgi:hypothetical protein
MGDAGLDNARRSLALAKAYDFAGLVPSVSRKYLLCAQGATEMDHELRMRTGEESVDGIKDVIEAENAMCSPEDENALLEKLGRGITQEERDAFEAYCWDWDMKATILWDEFSKALPQKWRE